MNFEAACVDDKIYAIGGGYPNSASVEVFDPRENIWRDCAPMIEGKYCHAVATYNGEIYVLGGMDSVKSTTRSLMHGQQCSTE